MVSFRKRSQEAVIEKERKTGEVHHGAGNLHGLGGSVLPGTWGNAIGHALGLFYPKVRKPQ